MNPKESALRLSELSDEKLAAELPIFFELLEIKRTQWKTRHDAQIAELKKAMKKN